MTDSRKIKNAKIIMLFCPAANILVDLVLVAAEQLEQEGFGEILLIENLVNGYLDGSRILLIESGYEDSCKDLVLQQQIKIDNLLILKDLGLEEDAELDDENIELVKEGIVAECVVIESQTPKFNCPCCG